MTTAATTPTSEQVASRSGCSWELFPHGLLVFERALGPSGPFRMLVSRVELCAERECACRDVTLRAVGLDLGTAFSSAQLTLESLRPLLDGPDAMEARLDIDSGLVEPDEDEGRVPLSGEWVDYVQSQVDGELLDLLHERWLRAKGWRPRKPQEAHRPARDAGKLLGWYETHPEDRRDLYLDGDSVFMADDLYCMNPACPCNEVTLDFAELVDDELTRSVGHLRLGLPDLNIVEWSSSGENRELVQRLWTAFQARHRQVADRLGKRKLGMNELGRLWFEAPAVKSKTTVGAERAGRNDPCPCGSGKKYKRCCAG